MGILTWFLFDTLGCLGAIAVNMLASELWAEAAGLSRWIVRKAVLLLPAADRERRNAEWLAHVEDRDGNLRKVFCALGCVRAALTLAEAEKRLAEELTLNLDYVIRSGLHGHRKFVCGILRIFIARRHRLNRIGRFSASRSFERSDRVSLSEKEREIHEAGREEAGLARQLL